MRRRRPGRFMSATRGRRWRPGCRCGGAAARSSGARRTSIRRASSPAWRRSSAPTWPGSVSTGTRVRRPAGRTGPTANRSVRRCTRRRWPSWRRRDGCSPAAARAATWRRSPRRRTAPTACRRTRPPGGRGAWRRTGSRRSAARRGRTRRCAFGPARGRSASSTGCRARSASASTWRPATSCSSAAMASTLTSWRWWSTTCGWRSTRWCAAPTCWPRRRGRCSCSRPWGGGGRPMPTCRWCSARAARSSRSAIRR